MPLDLLLITLAALVGVRLQRRPGADRLRERIWNANYVLLIPAAAVFAFLSIDLDRALLGVIACGVAAWWATVALGWLWARGTARTRSMRGALILIAGFPNTGFVGYPLAHLAFGAEGLRLAVIYDQVSLLIPSVVVSTIIARRHATTPNEAASLRRQVLLSPPLWTVLIVVALRLTIVREPVELDALGTVIGRVIGPIGFLLLGMSIPLHGFRHDRHDVVLTAGAVAIRLLAAPALVWCAAQVFSVDVPAALYLIAAMPTAFHALVMSRLNDLEVAVVRLGVVASTVIAVVGTVAWSVA
ncbi:MAG: putative AEC-type transporter [Thermoleophilia bacterium]|nr:putative AEC-type transporter [Thermoleophilia bacterium]